MSKRHHTLEKTNLSNIMTTDSLPTELPGLNSQMEGERM